MGGFNPNLPKRHSLVLSEESYELICKIADEFKIYDKTQAVMFGVHLINMIHTNEEFRLQKYMFGEWHTMSFNRGELMGYGPLVCKTCNIRLALHPEEPFWVCDKCGADGSDALRLWELSQFEQEKVEANTQAWIEEKVTPQHPTSE